MIVGVPKEVKTAEHRVAITPVGVRELTDRGHDVLIEKGSGEGSTIPDGEFEAQGATIVPSAGDVFGGAEMILKVKEAVRARSDDDRRTDREDDGRPRAMRTESQRDDEAPPSSEPSMFAAEATDATDSAEPASTELVPTESEDDQPTGDGDALRAGQAPAAPPVPSVTPTPTSPAGPRPTTT